MVETIKILYIYLFVASCVGTLFLAKQHTKVCFLLGAIAFFCIFWRSFSANKSSRYYSACIIGGIFLSTFLISSCSHLSRMSVRNIVLGFFLLSMLCLHLYKTFSSFKNTYILDLQNQVKTIAYNTHNDSIVCIYDDEYMRIRSNPLFFKNIVLFKQNNTEDILDYRVKNNYYGNDIYFIVPESNDSHKKDISLPLDSLNQRTKVEHHFSNSKHTKYLSLYKYSAYTPTPEVDIKTVFSHPELKTYIPEYDTFVYQSDDKLIWLIGANIDEKTEVIFHIFPDKPESLPSNRVQYGFDNHGFNGRDKSEVEPVGKYRVFVKDIPMEYQISYIHVGFNDKKSTVRARAFSVSQD